MADTGASFHLVGFMSHDLSLVECLSPQCMSADVRAKCFPGFVNR